MNKYIHEISVNISERLMSDAYDDRSDEISSAKVIYAIETIILSIKEYIAFLVLFSLAGKMHELMICMVTLMMLRSWTGGTHMNTSLKCCIVTILFYLIAIFGTYIYLSDEIFFIIMLLYLLICVAYAPLQSLQRPKLSLRKIQCMKFMSISGVAVVSLMYIYIVRYRSYIGRVALLQFIDVIIDILKRKVR